MATEQASQVTTEYGSLPKLGNWLAALVGLWLIVSSFVLTGSIESGTPMWSTVVAGVIILVLPAFAAYAIRSTAEAAKNSTGELAAWLAAIVGLWIIASPFVLTGAVESGTVLYSNIGAGAIAFILAGYAGYFLHMGE